MVMLGSINFGYGFSILVFWDSMTSIFDEELEKGLVCDSEEG